MEDVCQGNVRYQFPLRFNRVSNSEAGGGGVGGERGKRQRDRTKGEKEERHGQRDDKTTRRGVRR